MAQQQQQQSSMGFMVAAIKTACALDPDLEDELEASFRSWNRSRKRRAAPDAAAGMFIGLRMQHGDECCPSTSRFLLL